MTFGAFFYTRVLVEFCCTNRKIASDTLKQIRAFEATELFVGDA